jgi:2-polyprenyl-3-methyl-5-hydroxy-6-metoxy-1,4-benzoquinol methylase
MNIENIIDNINLTNGYTFNKLNISNLQSFINSFEKMNKLEYLDHGGTCLCFKILETNNVLDSNNILKIYNKSNYSTLKTSNVLYDYIKSSHLPIIDTKVIYEDKYNIIVIQPYVNIITEINPYITKEILKIIEIMLVNRQRLHDVYYRNFGFYNGKLYLIDFHESINFYDNIDLFVSNLFQLFSLLFNKKLAFGLVNPPINSIISSNFNYGFANFYADFLSNIYNYNIDIALSILKNNIYSDLGQLISKNINNYQHFNIDSDGKLSLFSHTLQKALIAENILNITNSTSISTSIIDSGCSFGSIGLYLKQKYPSIKLTLNNLDNNELIESKNLANWIACSGITYLNKNLIDILPVKYDITLCFALIHHLLKNYSFDDIILFIKLITNKIAIIEFPIIGDSLLANVMNATATTAIQNFYVLSSLDILHNNISKYANIIDVIKMDYGTIQDINRYTFIIKFL